MTHIQTAITAIHDPHTGEDNFVLYARNNSEDGVVIDAKPPATNQSQLLIYDSNHKKIGGGSWKVEIAYILGLPPHRVRSWEVPASSHWVRDLLWGHEGRMMMAWQLQDAQSPPLYLRVEGNKVMIYQNPCEKDRWKAVKFRTSFPKPLTPEQAATRRATSSEHD